VFRNVREVELLEFCFKEEMFDPQLFNNVIMLLNFCLVIVVSLDSL
jgi:hypothetical protein